MMDSLSESICLQDLVAAASGSIGVNVSVGVTVGGSNHNNQNHLNNHNHHNQGVNQIPDTTTHQLQNHLSSPTSTVGVGSNQVNSLAQQPFVSPHHHHHHVTTLLPPVHHSSMTNSLSHHLHLNHSLAAANAITGSRVGLLGDQQPVTTTMHESNKKRGTNHNLNCSLIILFVVNHVDINFGVLNSL